ncbi:hypothetical protein BKA62DRAFT_775411 [Auriculariales sp. MPI-PUGE-AT-0066]|nr:hypothetical protein BKA62DRAFT_775411 [Auriculariales sp. MPI-PUGE-AT-0066]
MNSTWTLIPPPTAASTMPASIYLLFAAACGASTVLAPKDSPSVYCSWLLMAVAVYRYVTAPTGTDFGLAMISATYVFQVIAFRIRSRSQHIDRTNLPTRQIDWLLMMCTNPRMIGYGGPVGEALPKRRFLMRRGVQLIAGLALLDACHAYFTLSTWFSRDAPLYGVRIATLPLWKQVGHSLAWVVYAYLLWFIPYNLFAFVSVAVGFSKTAEWPVLYSSWTEAVSVTSFWSKVWHQTHRHTYSTLADAACRMTVQEPGAPRPASAQYIKITVAFSIPAVFHAAGSLALPADPQTGKRGCQGAALFFLAQGCGVMLERWLSRKTSLRLPPVLGHMWLVAWGASTLILTGWLDELVCRQSIVPAESALLKLLR